MHFFQWPFRPIARWAIDVGVAVCCILMTLYFASAAAAEHGWGTLRGKIVVSGETPEISQENVGDHPDKGLCLIDGILPVDDNLVIGTEGELRDVFVMMVASGQGADAPVHPSYENVQDSFEGAAVDSKKIVIDNVACRFVPHALFVRSGTSVRLKNSDTVGHNCHITTFNNEHNVNLPAGREVNIQLKNSHRVPGQIKCDIHRWMDGVILVRDNPYVGITDSRGNFEIKNVPEGAWEFQFWHKKGANLKKLEIDGYPISRRGIIKVVIEADKTLDLGKMVVPGHSLNR